MTKDDKYGLFRQFMFNELQITKEDIRTWIKEAVEQQVEKMLHHTFGDFEPNERAAKLIADFIGKNWWANDKLKQAVAGQIVNRIKVTIESK
jgi:hypothetical protein